MVIAVILRARQKVALLKHMIFCMTYTPEIGKNMLQNKHTIHCPNLTNNFLPKSGKRMDDGIHWTSPGVRFQVSILCQVGQEDTVYEF